MKPKKKEREHFYPFFKSILLILKFVLVFQLMRIRIRSRTKVN